MADPSPSDPTSASGDPLHDSVARARGGDGSDLRALVVDHLPQLEAFVRVKADSWLIERESVQDVVQSVCREALVDRYRFHR